MNAVSRFLSSVSFVIGIASATSAVAASIEPNTVSLNMAAGEQITLERTVILDDAGPAASKVDVVFLADNTGSMGGVINTVKANAQTILDAIAGGDSRFAGIDVHFGVSSYNGDPREFGGNPASAYRIGQVLTDSREGTITAINGWYASGGGDTPEANFFALHQLATDGATTDGIGSTDSGIGTGLSVGWRPDAAKVIVWFGDAPSHTTTVDANEAIAALNANKVIVAAINTRGVNAGIDTYQQATQIADATGGSLTNNVVGTDTTIEAILNAVENATDTVDLNLTAENVPSGIDVSYECISAEGCSEVASGESRRFAMHVTASDVGSYELTSVVPQISGLVASDTINVHACVSDIIARAKRDKVNLVWSDTGADHYVVYRSDEVDGNYRLVGETTSRYSVYVDLGLTPNTSYYYQVREVNAKGAEVCSSVTTVAKTVLRDRPDTTPVNVAPTFTSTPVTSVNEDALYSYTLTASDANGDDVSFSLVSGPSGMQLSGDTLTWVPDNTFVGDHNVVLRAQDPAGLFDTQLFTLTVVNVNDAPVITSSAPLTARVNEAYQYAVNAIDVDAGDTLSYALVQAPAGMSISASGLIAWTPAFTQQGDAAVVLRVTDQAGAAAEQAYTISVGAVNNPPQITSSPVTDVTAGTAYSYQLVVSDPDLGDVHQFEMLEGPAGATLDENTGLLSWNNAVAGTYTVTLRVTDFGGLTDSQTFTLNVTAANAPPVITSTPVTDAVEGSLYQYDVIATDANGDTLTYTLTTAPAGMAMDASGKITWTPTAAQVGPQNVAVTVSDGTESDAQAYTVTVAARPNTAPVITSTPLSSVYVGASYSYQVVATDAEGDAIGYSLSSAPAGMTISGSGLVSWQASATAGSFAVVVVATDARGASTNQSFDVLVEDAPNQLPTITSTPLSTATEGAAYSYDVNASDADGDTLSYSLTTAPAGMVIDSASGLIAWTPSTAQVGSQAVTVQVSDGKGGTDAQSFTIVVDAAPNSPPTIDSTPVTTATEGAAYGYDVNATDADGDTLSYSLTAAPAGMAIDAASGLISWTPSAAQVGSQNVTVQVSDGNGGMDSQSFTISVDTAPNTPPTIDSTPLTTA
ncbi:MAG: putative Ig domain-containing protein, partial [Candidatus Thiodiazotropha sp.]